MTVDRAEAFIELSGLQDPLEARGYTVTVDESTATLDVGRPAVQAAAKVNILLSQHPAHGVRLLALDAAYPFAVEASAMQDLPTSLSIINNYLPTGHVRLDDDGSVHASWTLSSDADEPIGNAATIESIVAFDQMQQHFGDYVEGVCSGDIPAPILDELIQQAGDGG